MKNAKLTEEMEHIHETTPRTLCDNVNETTQTFITTQLSQQNKIVDEGIPKKFKCLHFLYKSKLIKAITCWNEWVLLFQGLPIQPGVSDIIFEKLRAPVAKMTDLDKTCALLFDEMVIDPDLSYDLKKDHVLGFLKMME